MTAPAERFPMARYRLIDKDGRPVATNVSAQQLALTANYFWPDQEQDETRSGKGWDIETVWPDTGEDD